MSSNDTILQSTLDNKKNPHFKTGHLCPHLTRPFLSIIEATDICPFHTPPDTTSAAIPGASKWYNVACRITFPSIIINVISCRWWRRRKYVVARTQLRSYSPPERYVSPHLIICCKQPSTSNFKSHFVRSLQTHFIVHGSHQNFDN